jgi:tRNA pseudouridine38-40 synthase
VLQDTPLTAGQRVAARVEYHGGYFHGWQSQPKLTCPTVQEAVQEALSKVASTRVHTICAGRTDTGVHGFGQVIHFEDPVGRSPKAWVMGTNRYLPGSVRLHWAEPVSGDFHARFSAVSRRYRYIVLNTPVRSSLLDGLVTWCRHALDVDAMHQAASTLVGERDFSAFRAAGCQAFKPMRCVTHCAVVRMGDYVVIDIVANAFLLHMVRNIAGSLLAVGSGARPLSWLAEVLDKRDRRLAAETAPAEGLYLVRVSYPAQFDLPDTPEGPGLLRGWM